MKAAALASVKGCLCLVCVAKHEAFVLPFRNYIALYLSSKEWKIL